MAAAPRRKLLVAGCLLLICAGLGYAAFLLAVELAVIRNRVHEALDHIGRTAQEASVVIKAIPQRIDAAIAQQGIPGEQQVAAAAEQGAPPLPPAEEPLRSSNARTFRSI